MMRFAVVLDDLFADHRPPAGHPERPQRIEAINRAVRNCPRFPDLQLVAPCPAQTEWLLGVHTLEHLKRLQATEGATLSLDADTQVGPASYQTGLLAAGSVTSLFGRILDGRADAGFALVRPPGHHAEANRAMGFCLFNNVAIAAEWGIRKRGLDRVAVVDFDVHHGNGTQHIFESRPEVFYISVHQHPLYPGTGPASERGVGRGLGYTLNFPIPAGRGDDFYLALFDEHLLPALGRYRPQAVLVSAGYDAAALDPLAGMELSDAGFGAIAARLNLLARGLCGGRILYVLEGGYHLQSLANGVLTTIEAAFEPEQFNRPAVPRDDYLSYRNGIAGILGPAG